MPKAICKNGDCDFANDNYEDKFCLKCGEEVLFNCPDCGTPIKSIAANNCGNCGRRYKDEPSPNIPRFGIV